MSGMGRMLCLLGLHKWKEQRTIEWRYQYGTLYFDGDVCQRCGEHRCGPAKVTEGLPQDYEVLMIGGYTRIERENAQKVADEIDKEILEGIVLKAKGSRHD